MTIAPRSSALGTEAGIPPPVLAAIETAPYNVVEGPHDDARIELKERIYSIPEISAMILQKGGMLSLIKESKRRGKTVVAGGPYPTSVLEPVLEAGADFVMQGEAENCMDRLLAALEREQPPVVITNSEKPVMTQSPVPRFDLLTLQDYVVMSFQTSRGCPFDCEFCDIVNLFGRVPRYKTPDQVIEEVETLYDLGWRKDLFICDDNFIGNKSHAKAILRKLIPWQESYGKPFGFWCQASVNLGKDIELIDMMTEANVHQVFVGIESPDTDVLERAHKYQNVRNSTLDMLHSLNKNGLGIVASFIIGFDGEKKGVGDRICNDFPGLQIFEMNGVFSSADCVHTKC